MFERMRHIFETPPDFKSKIEHIKGLIADVESGMQIGGSVPEDAERLKELRKQLSQLEDEQLRSFGIK